MPCALFRTHYWSSLGLSGRISVNWNLDKLFLFCAQFSCSTNGSACRMIRCGLKVSVIPPRVGLSSPARLQTPWLKTTDTHKHTHTHKREKRRRAILHWPEAEVREDYWTHCLWTEFTIYCHFSSLSLFLSLSYCTFSLSHFLSFSWQRGV